MARRPFGARHDDASSHPASDQDADFTEFVHASWPALYRTAYLLLGDRELAEDLAQTALAKTYAAWSRIDDRAAAPAYARRTLINTASSWFRKKGWRNELPTAAIPETGYAFDPSTRPAVLDALGRLPTRQRAVVVLRYYEDLSVAETADALGCSTGTVKSQTFEAFAKLRVLLGDAVIPTTLGAHHE
jgi:RNA polymerase sigma-70 factor (sigma-E family)